MSTPKPHPTHHALAATAIAAARAQVEVARAALLLEYQRAGHLWAEEFEHDCEPPTEILDLITAGELIDASWHHDIAPSFYHRDLQPADPHAYPHDEGGDTTRLWAHPANPLHREHPDLKRFNVCTPDNGDGEQILIETNDVRAAIECLRAAARRARFPKWTSYHTGGGCMALLREFPDGAFALLTKPGDPVEPTDPSKPMFLGLYHGGRLGETLEGTVAAAFNCRDLAHVESIVGALELIGETGIYPDPAAAVPEDTSHAVRMALARAEGEAAHATQNARAVFAAALADAVAPDDDDDADPNDCAECARQHGPHFTGRCTHGA